MLTRPAVRTAVAFMAVEMAVLALGLLLARRISLGVLRPVTDLLRLAAALVAEARRRRGAITSLMDSERRLRLVVAELNHRAKNALATVQSLAMQTARGEAGGEGGQFLQTFTARLQSLARAHDLLTA